MVRWKDGVRMKGLGLGREEPSFNHTRHSHSSGCDRIRHNRAPRANAQGPLGCDRYFSRNAIYSGRATLTLSLERIVATAWRVSGTARGKFLWRDPRRLCSRDYSHLVARDRVSFGEAAYRYASITLAIIVLIPR